MLFRCRGEEGVAGEVGDLLAERGGAVQQLAAVVKGQGGSVENKLAAAADQVDHQQGAAPFFGESGGGLFPLLLTAVAVRGGDGVDQQELLLLRAPPEQRFPPAGLQDALAGYDRHRQLAPPLVSAPPAGGEIALLPEGEPVLQGCLGIDGRHGPLLEQKDGVVELALKAVGCPQEHRRGGGGRERGQLLPDQALRCGGEAAVAQQILRRPAGESHLRKDDQPGTRRLRLFVKAPDCGGVFFQRTSGGIDLGEGEEHRDPS